MALDSLIFIYNIIIYILLCVCVCVRACAYVLNPRNIMAEYVSIAYAHSWWVACHLIAFFLQGQELEYMEGVLLCFNPRGWSKTVGRRDHPCIRTSPAPLYEPRRQQNTRLCSPYDPWDIDKCGAHLGALIWKRKLGCESCKPIEENPSTFDTFLSYF